MKDNKKVILVTGASAGIGKAGVEKLLSEGHIVYGAARRTDKMRDIESIGAKVMAMDVTVDKSMVDGINQIIKNESRIDVLINNAGYGSYGTVEEVPIEEAKRQFEVNIFGLARLTQLVLPHMREHKSGTVINVSSVGGRIYTPLGAWYHGTKHALEGWSDSLRLEVAQFGINVVVVRPGAIESEWNDIARENMIKVSGNGDYGDFTKKIHDTFAKAEKMASPASVIADVFSKAVNSKRPKTRYVAGKFAKQLLFMRWLLSDRLFDSLLMSRVK